jgi:hypothetical protein
MNRIRHKVLLMKNVNNTFPLVKAQAALPKNTSNLLLHIPVYAALAVRWVILGRANKTHYRFYNIRNTIHNQFIDEIYKSQEKYDGKNKKFHKDTPYWIRIYPFRTDCQVKENKM